MKSSRKRSTENKKRTGMQTSTAVLLLVLLFCLYSCLMMVEHSYIYSLDVEIRELESEYELALKKNDDLQTQLLSSGNLYDIEQYAADVLGMIKPQSSYISYVSYDSPESDDTMYANNSFISWVSELFN